MQEGHEVVSGFLETRGDTAIMLDLIEKAFDEMAFLIKMQVVDPLVEAIRLPIIHPSLTYTARPTSNAIANALTFCRPSQIALGPG